MRLRKLTSTFLAASIAATTMISTSIVVSAVTFTSADDFIADVIETALAGVESSTKDTAIATAKSKITISGDAVSYDGAPIGYWYSDSDTTLWADTGRTTELFKKTTAGYETDPTTLKLIMSDVNEDLVDTYTPSTTDWSKIIGRYDVKLGDITIPANQWIKCDIASNDKPITTNEVVNISALSGIDRNTIGSGQYSSKNIYILSYMIDSNGKLYLQNGIAQLFTFAGSWHATWINANGTSLGYSWRDGKTETTHGNASCSYKPLIKVGLTSSGTDLKAKIYATNTSHSDCDSLFPYESTEGDSFKITTVQLLNVNDGGDINSSSVADAKSVGVIYFTGTQGNITDSISCKNAVPKMYTSNSASRTVTGSALLTKRLAKITSLAPTDYLEVGSAGWLVNGTDNFDTYLGVQSLTMAGDTVDIDAVAEVEALNFNVVVPTTLPIYVASDGTITAATNATAENKSNAAVRITDIVISEKLESG